MLSFFFNNPEHKKWIRIGAVLWTFLILLLCFLPAGDIPVIAIPFIDKWAHFIMFGVFAFLWLASVKKFRVIHLLLAFIAAITLGWLVEIFQGLLTFIGRSTDKMDMLADALGGFLGAVFFFMLYYFYQKRTKRKSDKQ